MTTYYYSSAGSPAASGLDPANARSLLYNDPLSAETVFGQGHNILLASGSVWVPTVNNRFCFNPNMTTARGQFIDVYESDLGPDQPVWDSLLYDDGTGWVSLGDGRWQKTYAVGTLATDVATQLHPRAWAGITGPLSPRNNEVFKYRDTAAEVTGELQFNINGSVITVYSGSINPFVFYGGLVFNRSLIGTSSTGNNYRVAAAINGGRISNLTVRGGQFSLVYNQGMTLYQTRHESAYAGGIVLNNGGDQWCQSITLRECVVDYFTGENENKGTTTIWSSQDGIKSVASYTTGYCVDVDIVDCVIRGARHSAVDFQSTSAKLGAIRGVVHRGTKFGRSVVDSRVIDYGRAWAFDATGWSVLNMPVYGQCTASQMSGSGLVRGIQFLENRKATTDNTPVGEAGNLGTDSAMTLGLSSGGTTGHAVRPAMIVEGCVFDSVWNFPLTVVITRAAATAGGYAIIRGNTFIDQAHYYERITVFGNYTTFTPKPMPGACIMAFVLTAGAAGVNPLFPQTYQNAYVIPEGETTTALHCSNDYPAPVPPTGALSSYNYTKLTVNGSGGYVTTEQYENQMFYSTAAAGLDTAWVPAADSPLAGAGTYQGPALDGKSRDRGRNPTVGAYEPS
jgi:hypothetical protein